MRGACGRASHSEVCGRVSYDGAAPVRAVGPDGGGGGCRGGRGGGDLAPPPGFGGSGFGGSSRGGRQPISSSALPFVSLTNFRTNGMESAAKTV